ncbi:hypothetical protein SLOPH_879 [Spraguea lophii 42_110]|uniref:Uncharacterized protein n=1 Tax=Spraguea lophii (strain 42_110) TaxID=1358809 RepID=S7WBG5_SPRLO|nr:hypothetical protein SLOPH_879 [Spraguea lophii 42_110]
MKTSSYIRKIFSFAILIAFIGFALWCYVSHLSKRGKKEIINITPKKRVKYTKYDIEQTGNLHLYKKGSGLTIFYDDNTVQEHKFRITIEKIDNANKSRNIEPVYIVKHNKKILMKIFHDFNSGMEIWSARIYFSSNDKNDSKEVNDNYSVFLESKLSYLSQRDDTISLYGKDTQNFLRKAAELKFKEENLNSINLFFKNLVVVDKEHPSFTLLGTNMHLARIENPLKESVKIELYNLVVKAEKEEKLML